MISLVHSGGNSFGVRPPRPTPISNPPAAQSPIFLGSEVPLWSL